MSNQSLFAVEYNLKNILPYDGEAVYYGQIFDTDISNKLFGFLLVNILWKQDKLFIYGKSMTTKRKVARYGNENYEYMSSGTKRTSLPWTNELLLIKKVIEVKQEYVIIPAFLIFMILVIRV
jgi:hypothetical protein